MSDWTDAESGPWVETIQWASSHNKIIIDMIKRAVDWDTVASNCSTGNCSSNVSKRIDSRNKTVIEKFELDEGFQPYHPPFQYVYIYIYREREIYVHVAQVYGLSWCVRLWFSSKSCYVVLSLPTDAWGHRGRPLAPESLCYHGVLHYVTLYYIISYHIVLYIIVSYHIIVYDYSIW